MTDAPPIASQRDESLDSLRGLAALAVAVGHCFQSVPLSSPAGSLIERVLNGVMPQSTAVIIFFVLSGFVLGKSLDRRMDVASYMPRRILRLWLPVFAAAIFTFLVTALFWAPDRPLSEYPATPPDFLEAIKDGFLLQSRLNGVTWTISVELVGSLLLPFIILAGRRVSFEVVVVALIALSAVASSIFLDFLFCFAVGAGLAAGRWTFLRSPVFAAVAILLVWICAGIEFNSGLKRIALTGASAALIAWAAHNHPTFLTLRPIRLLGRISFSFYLLHIAGLTIAYWLARAIGLSEVGELIETIVFSVPFAFVFALVFFRYVELPSIVLGRNNAIQSLDRVARSMFTVKPPADPA